MLALMLAYVIVSGNGLAATLVDILVLVLVVLVLLYLIRMFIPPRT